MTTLHYKDYQGSVVFEDGYLLVQILHIDDHITATCDSAAEAQRVFQELVDDYLETCRQVGKEPSKPFRGSFNVRINPGLHRNAAMAAADSDESLNAWVACAIEQRLRRDQILKSAKDAAYSEAWATVVIERTHHGFTMREHETGHHRAPIRSSHSLNDFAEMAQGMAWGSTETSPWNARH